MPPAETTYPTDQDPRKTASRLVGEGRFDEAVKLLKPLAGRMGSDGPYWRVLGVAQGSVGDLDGAEVSLRRAVTLQPDSAPAHYHLADLLLLRGDLRESRTHANRAIALDDQLQAAKDLLDKLDAKKRAMRSTGFYVAPAAESAAMLDAVKALRNKASAVETVVPTPDAEVHRPISNVQLRMTRSSADDPITRTWSWDGFVWGLAAPVIWLAGHSTLIRAVVVLVAELAMLAYAWLRPSEMHTAAAVAVWALVAVLLGWRGNALSVGGRLWLSLGEFRQCHKIWLYWGCAAMAVVTVCAGMIVRSPQVAERNASLRSAALQALHHG